MFRRSRYFDLMPRIRYRVRPNPDEIRYIAFEEEDHERYDEDIDCAAAEHPIYLSRGKLSLVVNQ